MIKTIRLIKFRCFYDTTLNLKDLSILVGKNNAGKSTIIEALRLISFIANRYRTNRYVKAPEELEFNNDVYGIMPSVNSLPIELGENLLYFYTRPPAIIYVKFATGERFDIYIFLDKVFAVILDKNNKYISSSYQANQLHNISVKILPQIKPLIKEEKLINPDTIKEGLDTHLIFRHFRNEIYFFREEYFNKFKEYAEITWPGLQIEEIIQVEDGFSHAVKIHLRLLDNRFPAEVGQVGSGLQLWLQVIWFLCHLSPDCSVILDEPDVYMHPDLQIKLLELVRGKFRQVIIATHSVEIMASVYPGSILFVDKDKRCNILKYANDIAAVQRIVENIGGIYNLQLVRLGLSKRCIFVEGEDMKYLAFFYNKLFPEFSSQFCTIPHMEIEGFSNYREAIGSASTFKNSANDAILTYCILDRDYHLDEKIESMKQEAEDSGLNLHVWNMKEIENYFINPNVFYRIVHKKHPNLTCDEFFLEFNKIIDSFYDELYRQYASSFGSENRKLAIGTAMEQAEKYLNKRWNSQNNKIALIPGKKALVGIAKWIKNTYAIQLSFKSIVDEMKISEINQEMKDVLSAIHLTKSFEQYAKLEEEA